MPLPNLTGAVIAQAALNYKGAGYVYGGNASRVGDWDCSSFVSYVLGHDLALALPGGVWGGAGMPPGTHGPVVTSYASWSGAAAVGTPQAGDLCCWVGSGTSGHIGIAIDATNMISALNPSEGTKVTPIQGTGPAGSPLVYRRIVAGAAGLPVPSMSMATHAPLVALLIIAGVLSTGAGLAAVAGVAGAVLVSKGMGKIRHPSR